MLGTEVTQYVLNDKTSQAVLQLRSALRKVETIAIWLANHPVVEGSDPLMTEFGYDADEAYAMRLFFGNVNELRINNQNLADAGRKMTGLE